MQNAGSTSDSVSKLESNTEKSPLDEYELIGVICKDTALATASPSELKDITVTIEAIDLRSGVSSRRLGKLISPSSMRAAANSRLPASWKLFPSNERSVIELTFSEPFQRGLEPTDFECAILDVSPDANYAVTYFHSYGRPDCIYS